MPTVTDSSYRCHNFIRQHVNCDNYASLDISCGFQTVISNKSKTEMNNIAGLISPYRSIVWHLRLMLNCFHLSCKGSRAVSQHPQASATDKGTTSKATTGNPASVSKTVKRKTVKAPTLAHITRWEGSKQPGNAGIQSGSRRGSGD